MAIKEIQQDSKITLEIDNGDLEKFHKVMHEWNFKDAQSFLRFVLSIFLINQEKSIKIKMDGSFTDVVPSPDLLNQK